MNVSIEHLSREELYEQVWAEPMTKVSTRFGMSDVGLKKICKKHDIPVPGRGYWRKQETGKRVTKTPLPGRQDTTKISITVYERSAADGAKEPEAVATQRAFEEKDENRITVAETLARPHPLTTETKRHLKAVAPDNYGALKSVSNELFYLRVAPSSVNRALLVLDALLKAFKARGFDIQPSKRERGSAQILVQGEALTFSIEERVRQQPHRLTVEEKRTQRRGQLYWAPTYDYIPSGKLILKLDGGYISGRRSTWSDSARQRVEDRLNEFVVAIVQVAEWKKENRRKHAEAQRRRAEENARRAAVRERQEREAQAVEQLRTDAAAWSEAEEVRRYITAVRARAEATGQPIDPESETGRWLAWASNQADRLDPLRESPPSILDEEAPRPLYLWETCDPDC